MGQVRRVAARPALTTFGVALIVRAVAAMASFAANPRALIPDELQYLSLARTVATGHTADSWYPGYGQALYDSTRTFMAGLVVLSKIFDGSRLPAQLWVALAGAAAVAVATIIAGRVVPPAGAVAVGVLLALLPSQVLFSSVVVREAHVWLAIGLVWLGAIQLQNNDRRSLARGAALSIAGLLALGFLRQQTMLAIGGSLLVAVVVWPRRRLPHVGVVLAAVVILPWVAGIGLGGWTLVQRGSDSLARTRLEMAVGAGSAITPTSLAGSAPTTSATTAVTTTVAPGALGIANRRSSAVVVGPDGRPYAVDESVRGNLRALPRGFIASSLRPWPWESGNSLSFTLARVENLVWYVLYALALVALVLGGRERSLRQFFLFPVAMIGSILLISALTQGNIGTAFRHRQQIAAPVVVLAAIGADKLALRQRHRGAGVT